MDENDWIIKCKELTQKAKYQYVQDIIVWGQINSITEINSIYFFEEGYIEEDLDRQFNDVIKLHSNKKDFPVFKKPKLPENPILKFPWEQ